MGERQRASRRAVPPKIRGRRRSDMGARGEAHGAISWHAPVIRRLEEVTALIRAFGWGAEGAAMAAGVTESTLTQAGIPAEDVRRLLLSGLIEDAERPAVTAGPRRRIRLRLSAAGAALLRRTSLLVASTIEPGQTACTPLPR